VTQKYALHFLGVKNAAGDLGYLGWGTGVTAVAYGGDVIHWLYKFNNISG